MSYKLTKSNWLIIVVWKLKNPLCFCDVKDIEIIFNIIYVIASVGCELTFINCEAAFWGSYSEFVYDASEIFYG